MQTSPLLTQLMEALRCLPGVGPKSRPGLFFRQIVARLSVVTPNVHILQ